MDRRSFFTSAMSAAAISGILGEVISPRELMAAVEAAADAPSTQHAEFWGGFFDDVDPSKPHATMTRGPGGEPTPEPVPEHVQDEKLPRFFHYADPTGLRFAEKIDREELPKMDGAAVVSVSVSGFHSSEEDSHKIGDATSAQLQLHATQTTPMAQYIAPLAWASLASIFARSASITKLPTIEQLNGTYSDGSGGTSGNNRILLPRSEGKMALNLTLPDKHALLHKIISIGLQGAQLAAPLVTLPAISVPAIKAFTSFYNILVQNAGFIINSPLKDVVASYDAVDSGNMHSDALKLITGEYVIVPAHSTEALSAQMEGLKMLNGYLVPKDLAANMDPTTAAKAALPNVTYATLKVSVAPATDVTVPQPTVPILTTPAGTTPTAPAKASSTASKSTTGSSSSSSGSTSGSSGSSSSSGSKSGSSTTPSTPTSNSGTSTTPSPAPTTPAK
jgi:uncharacterized membrane protein YgcG